MADPTLERDAEQHARQLIEQAARYVQAALRVPDDIQTLRTVIAQLMLEVGILRIEVEQLQRQVRRPR